jgi:molybdopterin molybdotransferase
VNPLAEASWQAAREAAAMVAGVLPPEQVPVHLSPGRVLATNCIALCDLPSFDSSAMDGWAVAGDGPWAIVGDARAGSPLAQPLAPGTAARIATGAVVPTGTESVIRWEDARITDGRVHAEPSPGSDIRRAGEECRAGDLIARVGTLVTPALAGFLAATGHDHVAVVRRPRVHVLLLGDELQQSGIPSGGRVRDSLGPQLPGWLSRMGAEVLAGDLVADDLGEVASTIAQAARESDLVITTGGTAAGPRDHLRAAIERNAGKVLVDCVAVRPGHPMLLAEFATQGSRRVPLVGLPGNPHSAIVGLLTLAQPLIDTMLGRPTTPLAMVPTSSELRAPCDHTRLIAGNLAEGRFELSPYGGSAMLRGLAQSSGFAIVPEGTTPAGAHVHWLPLP